MTDELENELSISKADLNGLKITEETSVFTTSRLQMS